MKKQKPTDPCAVCGHARRAHGAYLGCSKVSRRGTGCMCSKFQEEFQPMVRFVPIPVKESI